MANRLRAMVSAMCLAEDLGRKLVVIWSANEPACMVRFDAIFKTSTLPQWMTVKMGIPPSNAKDVLSPQDLDRYLESGAKTAIRSYGHFYQRDEARWLAHLRSLQPAAEYESLAHPFFSKPAVVGVHIRRGDHTHSRAHSPTQSFLDAMNAEPAETVFIVATDDKAEKGVIEAAFPGRVFFPATNLSRMTLAGMNSALQDFLGLAKTKKIIGSYNSSFSEIAAAYGGIPLQVIKQ